MQDKKGAENAEVIRLIGWINNHHNWWEDITGFAETDPEVLLEMLRSLHEDELHTIFLTVLQKNGHMMLLNQILENVIWELIADNISCKMVAELENKIIRELENAQRKTLAKKLPVCI